MDLLVFLLTPGRPSGEERVTQMPTNMPVRYFKDVFGKGPRFVSLFHHAELLASISPPCVWLGRSGFPHLSAERSTPLVHAREPALGGISTREDDNAVETMTQAVRKICNPCDAKSKPYALVQS